MDTSDAVGFDFSGLTGTGYLSLTPPPGGISFLYTVGAEFLTFIGTIGTGFIVVDITAGVQGPVATPTATVTATVTTTSSPTVTRPRRAAERRRCRPCPVGPWRA